MEFFQVDVFSGAPFQGNPLAVFPDAASLSRSQMQAIATEMNLSETTFVTETSGDGYSMRIFTPREELPFAGHPTIGTAWLLRKTGRISGDEFVQRTPRGETIVRSEGTNLWFERTGQASDDLAKTEPASTEAIAAALGVEPRDIGLEARELGRPGFFRPGMADAGIEFLIVPLKDPGSLSRCRPRADLMSEGGLSNAYCFTATGAGQIVARGLFSGIGVSEDPATGSAAGALGFYLTRRLGPIDFQIAQGAQVRRPSRILVRAGEERVKVGGQCALIFSARLETLP
jgi:trans-2,3-dihydro-3-hydroxyanthranilate isomerase